jgi:Ca-activated chloride channel family protein
VPAATALGDANAAIAKLYGRELVEDLELQIAAGYDRSTMDREIERAGLDFQISTRLTSWVAVSKERTVDPGAPTRREEIPVELPYGMSIEGLGLRRTTGTAMGQAVAKSAPGAVAPAPMRMLETEGESAPEEAYESAFDMAEDLAGALEPEPITGASLPAAPPPPGPKDELRRSRGPAQPPKKPAAPAARPPMLERPEPEQKKADREAGAFTGRPGRYQGRRLAGRIVYRSGRRLVLEILVGGGSLDWKRPEAAVAIQRDGTSVPAKVEVEGSTRDGTYPQGTWIRVVLELSSDAGDIATVSLDPTGESITVVISG